MATKTKLNKNSSIKGLFGSLKSWKINTQKFKDERRKQDKKSDKNLFSFSSSIN